MKVNLRKNLSFAFFRAFPTFVMQVGKRAADTFTRQGCTP